MEVQAHAEHQEDDADLGERGGEIDVPHEPRRVGTDDDAGEQVADDRREADPVSEDAEDPCTREGGRDGRDEGDLVRHAGRRGDGRGPQTP